jgi:hypothetical protein
MKHQDSASSIFTNSLMAIMFMLKQANSVLHMHICMYQKYTCEKVKDIEINVAIVHDD